MYIDQYLVTKSFKCPIPALIAVKFIKKIKKNDVLTIESDDPLSQFDFKNFCEEKKYEIISLKKNGNLVNIKFKIQ